MHGNKECIRRLYNEHEKGYVATNRTYVFWGGRCVILGKGKTATAIAHYVLENSSVKDIIFIVEDQYSMSQDGSDCLSKFLRDNSADSFFLIFGFSNQDRADEIAMEILNPLGVKNFFIPFPFCFNESGNYIDEMYYEQHKREFDGTRKLLDKDSQVLFDTYIKSLITGDISLLQSFRRPEAEQYFHRRFMPTEPVQFLDVGAFTGDSLQYAISQIEISKYVAFEPDLSNVEYLVKRVADLKCRFETQIVKAGVFSETKELFFESAGSSSGISDKGNEKINVVSLDSIIDCHNNSEKLFIKMDIEGSEEEALIGAKNLIKNRHPYMAICVYHKIDDLIRIPQYINSLVPYTLGLGYYGNNYRELVLYAAPKETV